MLTYSNPLNMSMPIGFGVSRERQSRKEILSFDKSQLSMQKLKMPDWIYYFLTLFKISNSTAYLSESLARV